VSAVVSRSLERKTFRLEQKIEIHQNYYKNHKNAQKIIIINQKHKLTKKIISGKYQITWAILAEKTTIPHTSKNTTQMMKKEFKKLKKNAAFRRRKQIEDTN